MSVGSGILTNDFWILDGWRSVERSFSDSKVLDERYSLKDPYEQGDIMKLQSHQDRHDPELPDHLPLRLTSEERQTKMDFAELRPYRVSGKEKPRSG